VNCGPVVLFIRDRVTAIRKGPSTLPHLATNHGMISHYGHFTVTLHRMTVGNLNFRHSTPRLCFVASKFNSELLLIMYKVYNT